jgi:hypothetical protein
MELSSLLNLLTIPAELISEGAVPGLTPLNLLILAGALFVVSAYYLVSKYLKKKKMIKQLEDDINFELEQLPWNIEAKEPQFLELPPPVIDISDVPDLPKPAKKKAAKKKAAKKKAAKKTVKDAVNKKQ